jgi:hypothetical protein
VQTNGRREGTACISSGRCSSACIGRRWQDHTLIRLTWYAVHVPCDRNFDGAVLNSSLENLPWLLRDDTRLDALVVCGVGGSAYERV